MKKRNADFKILQLRFNSIFYIILAMKFRDFIVLLVLIAAIFVIYNKNMEKLNTDESDGTQDSISKTYEPVKYNSNFAIDIPVNRPVPLSYKTKAEVYNLRKNAVNNSIFKNPDYEPSDTVFGQIEDGKPWKSLNACSVNGRSDINGASEESRFILNPTILVAATNDFRLHCTDNNKILHLTPISVKYFEPNKEIIVTYDRFDINTLDYNTYYEFNGLNARDFGYKYAYIDKEKTTYDLIFVNGQNIGNQIVEFKNYIHTGGSCGVPGGCNNGSPNQPMLDFHNSHRWNTPYKQYREIYIKLWKNMPKSPQDEADINERIIIEHA